MEAKGKGDTEPRDKQHTMKVLKKHSRLSILMFAIGFAFMVIIGIIDDDPTIPPVVLMAFGIGWFVITRLRIRSHIRESNQYLGSV